MFWIICEINTVIQLHLTLTSANSWIYTFNPTKKKFIILIRSNQLGFGFGYLGEKFFVFNILYTFSFSIVFVSILEFNSLIISPL